MGLYAEAGCCWYNHPRRKMNRNATQFDDIDEDSPVVHEVLQRCARRRILPILEWICEEYGVSLEELVSTQRSRLFHTARHHLWAELYEKRNLSYPDIAWIFLRDHTSILHGVRKHIASPRAKLYKQCTAPCLEASCA